MNALQIAFLSVLMLFTACTYRLDTSNLAGVYVAKYYFGSDKIKLDSGGIYHQWVSIGGDSTIYEASGNWQFDSTSNYITIENKILVVDGFGNLRKDYGEASSGLSFLPVWRKFFFGKINVGTDELTPYEKIE